MQPWIIEIREEPGQIPAQGKVGAAESFMGVSPLSFTFRAAGPLFQKHSPLFVPLIEQYRELLARCPRERECDLAQLFARLKLRTARELQGNGL